MKYENMPMDLQIKVNRLIKYHNNRYPLSWYENLSKKKLLGMHTDCLISLTKDIEKQFTG
ncbi:hypothetical protein D3C81_428210 [compost metagenome]